MFCTNGLINCKYVWKQKCISSTSCLQIDACSHCCHGDRGDPTKKAVMQNVAAGRQDMPASQPDLILKLSWVPGRTSHKNLDIICLDLSQTQEPVEIFQTSNMQPLFTPTNMQQQLQHGRPRSCMLCGSGNAGFSNTKQTCTRHSSGCKGDNARPGRATPHHKQVTAGRLTSTI